MGARLPRIHCRTFNFKFEAFGGTTTMRMKTVVSLVALLLCAGDIRLNAAGSATVNVDFGSPLQAIEGFGAGIPWVAGNLNNFSASDQTRILDAIYSTTQ